MIRRPPRSTLDRSSAASDVYKRQFFNFAKHYAVTHHPAKSFEVDDVVLQDFRKFMDDEKIAYTEAELLENNAWVRSNIKSEIFVDVFGQEEGLKVPVSY